MHYLLPAAVSPYLSVLAQVGVVLYMFLVGVELDAHALRRSSHAAVAVSLTGILVPFVMGAALALWLYPRLSSSDVPFAVFALFLGLALSITAFPVLARILTDRGLRRSELGLLALGAAAVNDVAAWCLLALVVGTVSARVGGAVETLALTLVFIVTITQIVRPAVVRYCAHVDRRGAVGQQEMAVAITAILVSAITTAANPPVTSQNRTRQHAAIRCGRRALVFDSAERRTERVGRTGFAAFPRPSRTL
jgi:Kef-type K+ transport system membrane component KefB